MSRNRRALAALLLSTALAPGGLAAQAGVTARAEVTLLNHYQWRGIRRSDGPVAQGGALLGARVTDPVWISIGGWGSMETRAADGRRRSDLATGTSGLAEKVVWAAAEIARPGWSVAAGVTRSWLRRAGADAAATESMLRVERVSPVIAPRLEIWHDHGGGRGSYLELGLSRIIANPLAGPGVNLVLTASTGYAAGVADSIRVRRGLPGFTRTGFTHSALALALRLTPRMGPLELALDVTPRLQLGYDPATRARLASEPPGGKAFRGGVEISIGLAFPRRIRE